jgi:hypothetical protein
MHGDPRAGLQDVTAVMAVSSVRSAAENAIATDYPRGSVSTLALIIRPSLGAE